TEPSRVGVRVRGMAVSPIEDDGGPARVSLVVVDGAAGAETLLPLLEREAFVIERVPASSLGRAGGPSGTLAILWLPAGASDDLLERAVRWRAQAGRPAALLGCAPDGTNEDSERALGVGFDDFIAGRRSPREVSVRLRALLRRLRAPARRNG